jgi:hypothetical protein
VVSVAGHAACGHRGCTSALDECWWTGPNLVTALRTLGTVVLWGMALVQSDEWLLLAALLCYWVGDIADGLLARLTGTETRTGAALDRPRLTAAPLALDGPTPRRVRLGPSREGWLAGCFARPRAFSISLLT